MESRRLGMLVALALTVSVVAVGAGYISGGGSGEAPEGEPPDDIYTGPEDLNASNGNASSLGWLCGAGATDAYGNYSPDSYADYDYELANESNKNEDGRHINPHMQGQSPKWIREDEFNMSAYVNKGVYTYEVTKYPNKEPTREDLEEAWTLYNKTYESAHENGWFDIDNATEDGYVRTGNHYYNYEYYFTEGQLNPNKPPSLVYYQDPSNETNMILAGVMYEDLRKEGKQIAGPLTVWHYHPHDSLKTKQEDIEYLLNTDFRNMEEVQTYFVEVMGEPIGLEHKEFDFLQDMFDDPEEVKEIFRGENGINANRSSEMIHVWFVDHPEGPFGTGMSVPEESLTEPKKMSEERFKQYLMKKFQEKYGNE